MICYALSFELGELPVRFWGGGGVAKTCCSPVFPVSIVSRRPRVSIFVNIEKKGPKLELICGIGSVASKTCRFGGIE